MSRVGVATWMGVGVLLSGGTRGACEMGGVFEVLWGKGGEGARSRNVEKTIERRVIQGKVPCVGEFGSVSNVRTWGSG